ncbi:hypothetical protein CTAYLR_003137 [Chrysophaeum taylorii]|uniref:Potassium channel domain-containing protein n=1 Tax=Chrysophaeum taylorii TaxID=2483200 RepID=A0AAD7UQ28_9STRA|nr:hypothetical protein CTAYLR_003137 [Chrysophaeum taylorii]
MLLLPCCESGAESSSDLEATRTSDDTSQGRRESLRPTITRQRKFRLQKERERVLSLALEESHNVSNEFWSSVREHPPAHWPKVVAVVTYYALGCAFFCLHERFSVLETCYWLTVTVTTVGYGDVAPTSDAGRVVGIIFIFVGLVVIFPIMCATGIQLIESFFPKHRVVDSVGLLLLPLAVVFLFFWVQEVRYGQWSHVDAVWWSVSTVTTVGFGDLEFSNAVRCQIFLTAFIPASVVAVSAAITNLASARETLRARKKEAALLKRFDSGLLNALDDNQDGNVDKTEYALGMLRAMALVDPKRLERYYDNFAELQQKQQRQKPLIVADDDDDDDVP